MQMCSAQKFFAMMHRTNRLWCLFCWRRNASSMADDGLIQKLNTFFGEKVILFIIVLM